MSNNFKIDKGSKNSLKIWVNIQTNTKQIFLMYSIYVKICGAKPQECSLHILLAVPELLSTEQSPHGRTVGRPAGLF